MKSWGCALLLSLAVAPSVAMSAESSTPSSKASVYGHRGASALRPEHTLFTYLHLAPAPELTRALQESGATCVAYETVEDARRRLPMAPTTSNRTW